MPLFPETDTIIRGNGVRVQLLDRNSIAEPELMGAIHPSNPPSQKQQGHPQQAQAEAVESLGFAGLLRSARWSSSAWWSG